MIFIKYIPRFPWPPSLLNIMVHIKSYISAYIYMYHTQMDNNITSDVENDNIQDSNSSSQQKYKSTTHWNKIDPLYMSLRTCQPLK